MRESHELTQTFRLVLIKFSHYDDDGYVIQWFRSAIPSNTLAVLYALALDSARRRVLGEEVEIVVDASDETNTILPMKKIIRDLKQAAAGMVGLVGVQSNQFPHVADRHADRQSLHFLSSSGVGSVLSRLSMGIRDTAILPNQGTDQKRPRETGVYGCSPHASR